MLTSIDSILEREGYDYSKVRIALTKTLADKPKMIEAIDLEIFYPEKLNSVLLKKLERAMALCPVKRSLNPRVAITTRFVTEE